MLYKDTLNNLIFEELSISGEVQKETINIWDSIINMIPDIKTDLFSDTNDVYYGQISFKLSIFGDKTSVFINYYNFLNKESFDKHKNEFKYLNAFSMVQGKMRWLSISIPAISGSVIMEPDIKDGLQHELEHLYQGKLGSSYVTIEDSDYAKARDLLNNTDKDISSLALIIYLSNLSEQDAYVNGLYAYLMSQEEPMINIKWDIVKNSEAYIHLISIKKIIDKLKIPDENLNYKCKHYFGYSQDKMLKLAINVENRFIRKIGKVLAKYYKDIRTKYPIKEYYSGKIKFKPNYFC